MAGRGFSLALRTVVLVLVALLHLLREWLRGRYAHFRRFSWLTGVLALWLLLASGIGGFWLVWDSLAQYSLIATTEWFDALPFFDGTLIRNFIAVDAVNRPQEFMLGKKMVAARLKADPAVLADESVVLKSLVA